MSLSVIVVYLGRDRVFTSDKYLLVVYVMDFVSDPETVCAVTDACC